MPTGFILQRIPGTGKQKHRSFHPFAPTRPKPDLFATKKRKRLPVKALRYRSGMPPCHLPFQKKPERPTTPSSMTGIAPIAAQSALSPARFTISLTSASLSPDSAACTGCRKTATFDNTVSGRPRNRPGACFSLLPFPSRPSFSPRQMPRRHTRRQPFSGSRPGRLQSGSPYARQPRKACPFSGYAKRQAHPGRTPPVRKAPFRLLPVPAGDTGGRQKNILPAFAPVPRLSRLFDRPSPEHAFSGHGLPGLAAFCHQAGCPKVPPLPLTRYGVRHNTLLKKRATLFPEKTTGKGRRQHPCRPVPALPPAGIRPHRVVHTGKSTVTPEIA